MSEREERVRPRAVPGYWRWAALALILLAGAGLRLPDLAHTPYGIWYDEAINGLDAAQVWQPGGHFRIYYADAEGFPREPMYQTIIAFTVRAFGPSVVALRATSAAIGLLTILLVYFFARRWLGEPEALAAAGVLATLRWHAIFSRLIFRTLLLGPWMLGVVWAALAYNRRRTPARALLLGLFIGGGFYTYLAWWFMLPVVAGIVVWAFCNKCGMRNAECGINKPQAPGSDVASRPAYIPRSAFRIPHFLLFLLAAFLTVLPLGIFFARHPDVMLARPGTVSVFSGGFGSAMKEILKNVYDAVRMFHWRGDHVPLQNIPWKPALDPLQGVLFLIGIFLALRAFISAFRNPRSALYLILLAWVAFGMATTIFTHTDSPNFLRSLCMTPAVAMLIGLGLAALGRKAARHWGMPIAIGIVAALLCASGALSAWDIYGVWRNRPEVWHNLHGDLTDLALTANTVPAGTAVMMPADLCEHPAFRFQTLGKTNIYPYSDWASLLGPWPPSPAAKGRPEPRRRWIVVTAMNGLIDPLTQMIPNAGVNRFFTAPEGNRWAAMVTVAEDQLPTMDSLAKLQKNWQNEMRH